MQLARLLLHQYILRLWSSKFWTLKLEFRILRTVLSKINFVFGISFFYCLLRNIYFEVLYFEFRVQCSKQTLGQDQFFEVINSKSVKVFHSKYSDPKITRLLPTPSRAMY